MERYEFSPNFKAVPLKLGLPCPFEVLDVFGGKSKSDASKVFKFSTKWVPLKVNNWCKFGVDTTFEKLKFEHFSLLIPSLVGMKMIFKNYFHTN